MARSHSWIAWSVVFGLLTAASLYAAVENRTGPAADKPQLRLADNTAQDTNPFAAADDKPAKSTTRDHKIPKEPAKPPAKKPQRVAAQEMQSCDRVAAIEKALASPIQLEFVEAPLQDVIDYLKSTKEIEIQMDKRVLEDVNVTSETPVTISVKGIRLESALRLMLRNMQPELTYVIRDEVLLITTPDVASEELNTRLYPVADLVGCRDEHDVPWDDYDSLIDVITTTIKPTTWEMVGAQGSVQGNTFGAAKVLVVTQTRSS